MNSFLFLKETELSSAEKLCIKGGIRESEEERKTHYHKHCPLARYKHARGNLMGPLGTQMGCWKRHTNKISSTRCKRHQPKRDPQDQGFYSPIANKKIMAVSSLCMCIYFSQCPSCFHWPYKIYTQRTEVLYKKYAVKELTFGVLHHHLKPGLHATSSLGSLFPSSVTIHKSVHGSHSESNVKDTNVETQLEKNRVLVTLVYDTIPFSVKSL